MRLTRMQTGSGPWREVRVAESYRDRDELLQDLGLPFPYRAYLQSQLWKTIRQSVLDRAGGKCKACRCRKRLHVHHVEYTEENLSGKELHFMAALCKHCHHHTEHGKAGKRTLAEARRTLKSGGTSKAAKARRAAAKKARKIARHYLEGFHRGNLGGGE